MPNMGRPKKNFYVLRGAGFRLSLDCRTGIGHKASMGTALDQWLERARVEEAELARQSGVARSVIYRVRRGHGASARNLLSLARVTGLRIEDMLPSGQPPAKVRRGPHRREGAA